MCSVRLWAWVSGKDGFVLLGGMELCLGLNDACSVTLFYFCDHFFNFNYYLFIFGCIVSSLLHSGFLYLQRVGVTLCCSVRASHCGGFSCCGAWALGEWASVVVARRFSVVAPGF